MNVRDLTCPSFALFVPFIALTLPCLLAGLVTIRPQFCRQGFGRAVIQQIFRTLPSVGSTELWVYAGSHDDAARIFYISLDFEVLGPASDYAPGKTMDDSDIVLRRILAAA
jgi:ribosomal protein S18 acetylase RimI-like enzyme